MNKGYLYLASPYASPDPALVKRREHATYFCTAHLINKGMNVFSPIVHNCILIEHYDGLFAGWEHEDFIQFDLPLLRGSSGLIVLKLPGWGSSKGVLREMKEANEMKKLVIEYDPQPLFSVEEWGELHG